MESNDIGQLLYLALLGTAIAGIFVAGNRDNLGKLAQQAAIWALIFVGAIAVVGLWSDIRDEVAPRQSFVGEGTIEVPRGFDGHYRLTLGIEGTPVEFIVDTGATDLVLSQRDAARAGLDPETLAYLGRARTANGTVPIAQVMLDSVTLADMTDRNVRASVNGGEMSMSLLGMSYLERFGRIEIADGRLILER